MPDQDRPQRNPNDPVRVFYVRAERDDNWCQELDTHLALYRKPNRFKNRPTLLETWNPGSVEIGAGREAEIRRHLEQAELAIAFISPHLWESERYGDLVRAWELRGEGKLRLVPIIARPVPADHDLSELAALPRRNGPLDQQRDRDKAYVEIVEELIKMVHAIQALGTATAQPGSWSQRDPLAEVRRKATQYSGPAPQIEYSGSQRPIVKGDAGVREGLERVVRVTNELLDIDEWYARLGRVRRRVCKIQLPTARGTGFLIGPDLVLTNYHVVESLIHTPKHAEFVSVIFDAAVAAAGDVAAKPRECTLRLDGWLVDASRYSALEQSGPVDPEKIQPDELDYAVLRLAEAPGDDDVGGGRARGWLKGKASPFLPGSPLFIVQHPNGGSMKLALDTDAVVKLSSNGLRVTYRTNTEPGSSGAPCFDQQWELVALHHHGANEQNQGIPIMKIVEAIKKKVELQPPPP